MENKITNHDEWFVSNLRCLIGAELYQVKLGIKKEIDKKMLGNFVKKHIKATTQQANRK